MHFTGHHPLFWVFWGTDSHSSPSLCLSKHFLLCFNNFLLLIIFQHYHVFPPNPFSPTGSLSLCTAKEVKAQAWCAGERKNHRAPELQTHRLCLPLGPLFESLIHGFSSEPLEINSLALKDTQVSFISLMN